MAPRHLSTQNFDLLRGRYHNPQLTPVSTPSQPPLSAKAENDVLAEQNRKAVGGREDKGCPDAMKSFSSKKEELAYRVFKCFNPTGRPY